MSLHLQIQSHISVLFLILAFFNSAGLFILIGAEFLAMILVVVYVGAVAVLFMFVVMMLDINFVRLREGFMQYLPAGVLVGVILLAELVLVGGTWVTSRSAISPASLPPATTNTADPSRLARVTAIRPTTGTLMNVSYELQQTPECSESFLRVLQDTPGVSA